MLCSSRVGSHLPRLLLLGSVVLCVPTQVLAQEDLRLNRPVPAGGSGDKGQSVEDMFKNVARAKAERGQLDSAGGETRGQISGKGLPQPIPSSRNGFPAQSAFPQRGIPENTLRWGPNSVEPLSSRPLELRQSVVLRSFAFKDDLKRLDRQAAMLAQLLRDDSQRNPSIRNVLPSVNRLSSDVRVMLQNMVGNPITADVVDTYCQVDQDWRKLEFQLQGVAGLRGDALEAVHECEVLISRTSRQLGLLPQFDRRELHNLLLITGTKLSTLIDDLRFAGIEERLRHSLLGTLRVLRQDSLNLVDRVGDFEQKDVVVGLEKLNVAWRRVASELQSIADVHVQQRVQDVDKVLRNAHGLVWLTLPTDTEALPAAGTRLVTHCRLLVADLKQRLSNADRLTGVEQISVSAESVLRESEALNAQLSQGVPFESWEPSLIRIEQTWNALRVQLVSRGLATRQTVSAIDDELRRLRSGFGGRNATGVFDPERLLRIAAAIQSTAGFVDADLQRYGGLLSPLAFRDTTLAASSAFLRSARLFHQLLDQRADRDTVRRAAAAMQADWKRLFPALGGIQLHGVSPRRAKNLLKDHRQLVEYMSEVSAFLLP